MRITLTERLKEHQRYGRDAFASAIGKQAPLTINGHRWVDANGQPATAVLIAATIKEGGRVAELTYELPDGSIEPSSPPD